MDFADFAEGPLLWAVFITFVLVISVRLIFFLYALVRSGKEKTKWFSYTLFSIVRALLPYQKGILRKPAYSALRYIFHICLFILPVGLGGHVVLLEESRFGWNWPSLPDPLSDSMTLLLLGIARYFLIRRLSIPSLRQRTSKSNYLLIVVAALPFMTGYFLAHGTLNGITFLGDQMRTIHVLAGEALLILAMFLFYRAELILDKCTGCASCVVACPTETLTSKDEGRLRSFSYLHYQCICCASCVLVCPERAAELVHEIKPRKLFQLRFKEEIRSTPLLICMRCGTLYAPVAQLAKISQKIKEDFVTLCPQCRMLDYGEKIRKATAGLKSQKAGRP